VSVEKVTSRVERFENGCEISHIFTQSGDYLNIESVFKFLGGQITYSLHSMGNEEFLFKEVLMDSEKEERATRKQKAQIVEEIFRNCLKKYEEYDNT
jgi:hypothetical protein